MSRRRINQPSGRRARTGALTDLVVAAAERVVARLLSELSSRAADARASQPVETAASAAGTRPGREHPASQGRPATWRPRSHGFVAPAAMVVAVLAMLLSGGQPAGIELWAGLTSADAYAYCTPSDVYCIEDEPDDTGGSESGGFFVWIPDPEPEPEPEPDPDPEPEPEEDTDPERDPEPDPDEDPVVELIPPVIVEIPEVDTSVPIPVDETPVDVPSVDVDPEDPEPVATPVLTAPEPDPHPRSPSVLGSEVVRDPLQVETLNPVDPGEDPPVRGSGCEPATPVTISLQDGSSTIRTESAVDGSFEAPIDLDGVDVGRHPVIVTCGDRDIELTVDKVVTVQSANAAAGVVSIGAIFAAFLLLLAALRPLRGLERSTEDQETDELDPVA